MLSLTERAFGPTSSSQDNITFMTSMIMLNSVKADTSNVLVEQIKDLISTTNTRLKGLQLLELTLQQNPDVYYKARWTPVLFDILKEPISLESKEKVCKIFRVIISILLKDPASNAEEIQRFVSTVCPYLMKSAQNRIEWSEAAFHCIADAVKSFPSAFDAHKSNILNIILLQTNSSSLKKFEVYAECFSYLPFIQTNAHPEFYQENWTSMYLFTLNTMNYILNNLLSAFSEDKKIAVDESAIFSSEFQGRDDFESRLRQVRQFINLCACLGKMLSHKSKHPVKVPIDASFECIKRLFDIEAIIKLDPNSLDNHILLSTLSQLQIAGLNLLEPLLINFNSVLYNCFIVQLLKCGLKASVLNNVSKEPICQLRHIIWKVISSWISEKGPTPTTLISRDPFFLKELFKDISIQEKVVQPTDSKSHGKSKRKSPSKVTIIDNCVNKNLLPVCQEALKALRKLIYGGLTLVSKKLNEDMFYKVVQLAHSIHPSEEFPFPYSDECCRKNLYKVLLAFTAVAKPAQIEALQHAVSIFSDAMRDPSNKVTSVCCEASAVCRLVLHPKKPPPVFNDLDDSRSRAEANSAVHKYSEWVTEEGYVENIPPAEQSIEPIPHSSQSFHPNDVDMHSNDFSQEACYSEQAADKQKCNGEDILEFQNASQCQEEAEDEEEEEEDEEEEEEDEEEDDEVEEMSSEKDMVVEPQIIPEIAQTVGASEPEELRPNVTKVQAASNAASSSTTKSMHFNGVNSSETVETPQVASEIVLSENGIILSEDEEELEEEEAEDDKEEDEEDEEDRPSFPAEKRCPEFIEPAEQTKVKKLKIDSENQAKGDSQNAETGKEEKSPTLEEMKADLILSDGEEVAS